MGRQKQQSTYPTGILDFKICRSTGLAPVCIFQPLLMFEYFFFIKMKILFEYFFFVEVKMILSFGLGRWGLAKTLNKPGKAFLTESHLSILPRSMMGTKSHHTNKINKSLFFFIILYIKPRRKHFLSKVVG